MASARSCSSAPKAREEAESAFAEQARLQGLLSAVGETHQRFELEKARKQNAFQVAEMDALRQKATSMEHRIITLESALDILREVRSNTDADTQSMAGELVSLADELNQMAERLPPSIELPLPLQPSAQPEAEDNQSTLFESLPVDFSVTEDREASFGLEGDTVPEKELE